MPAYAARRTVLQKVRGRAHTALPQFINTGFQVLFHSPPGVLFTFPSQYYALSVTGEYSGLRGGPRSFHQGSTCLDVLWIPPCRLLLRIRGFHPLWPAFPKPFCWIPQSVVRSEPRDARIPVWPPPLSLAATYGIDVSFFSSGYLDVSVRRVPLRALWIGARMHGVFPCGFPHSDIRGSTGICPSPRLFAACHVLLRLPVPRHPPCALTCLTLLRHIALCRLFPLVFCCCCLFLVKMSSHSIPTVCFCTVCSFQGTCNAFCGCLGSHGTEKPLFLSGRCPDSLSLFFFSSFFKSGSRLLSHTVPSAVPSAASVLTIVFGMGTGVSPKRIATGSLPEVIPSYLLR